MSLNSSGDKDSTRKYAMIPVPFLCDDCVSNHKSEVPHDEFVLHGTYSDMMGSGYPASVLTGKNHERPIEGCQCGKDHTSGRMWL